MDEHGPLSEIGRACRFRPHSIISPGCDRDGSCRDIADVAIPDDPRLLVLQPGEDSFVTRRRVRPRFLPLVCVLAPQPTPRVFDEAEDSVEVLRAYSRDLQRGYYHSARSRPCLEV